MDGVTFGSPEKFPFESVLDASHAELCTSQRDLLKIYEHGNFQIYSSLQTGWLQSDGYVMQCIDALNCRTVAINSMEGGSSVSKHVGV